MMLSVVCRRLWSSVVVCNTPWRRICNVTHQGAARDGGSVALRPVRATPCLVLGMAFAWRGPKPQCVTVTCRDEQPAFFTFTYFKVVDSLLLISIRIRRFV